MKLIDTYLDRSEPDPPLVAMPSIRVSHLIAHPCSDPFRTRVEQLADDFGLSVDAVLACLAYYMQHRPEINAAIYERNTAYQDEMEVDA